MGTQLMEDLLEIGVGLQELPFERGNVCGELCKTMGTQLMEDLLEIGVGLQELPFERGNVCGEPMEMLFYLTTVYYYIDMKSRQKSWRRFNEFILKKEPQYSDGTYTWIKPASNMGTLENDEEEFFKIFLDTPFTKEALAKEQIFSF
ncbi:hypothetical protein Glove_23g131 [Diversispora epigaea]|uniref:Uncharacterized protein n=1 Tax=Diversispora epigaea TaxID=1348612 RepID=A0A397JNH0_9GLOM|nr:hypothetical protein Glove_23g131 [Diversispora epigaea]